MKPKSISELAMIMAVFMTLGATIFSANGVTFLQSAAAQQNLDLSILGDLSNNGVAACGVVLTADTTLNSNLECDGPALTAGANDITINLDGYTIQSGNGDELNTSVNFGDQCGIKIPNHSDVTVVGPGLISGFDRGICYEGSNNGSVSDVILRDNEAAIISFGSDGLRVEQVKIDSNDFGIVAQGSNDGRIVFNLIGENSKQGIVLIDSDGWRIAGNSIIDNGANGVFVDAQSNDNRIDFNTIFGHSEADLNNANGLPPDINNNAFGDNNNCETSRPGGLC
jgi:parallel beta-helix repeat protein